MATASEKNLSKYTVQRTVLIEQQKRIKTFMDIKKDAASLMELKLRYDAMQKQFSSFQSVQSAIEVLDAEELTNSIRAEYEEFYYQYAPIIQSAIENHSDNNNDEVQATHTDHEHGSKVCYQNIKLHRIEIKKFSGDLTKWMAFYESFEKLIHENKSLDKLTKFHYLRDALTDGAERVIDSLELTSQNYDEALKLLQERFHNSKLICREHIRQLFDHPAMTTCSSESIRNIVDFFNSHLRALSTLGRPTKEWNDLVVHLLYIKLDDDTRAKFDDDSSPNQLPTLDELMKFLNRRSQTLEGSSCIGIGSHNQPNKNQRTQRTTLVSSSLPSNKTSNYCCIFCQKTNHLMYKCHKFLALNSSDRQKEVKRLNVCFNCLSTSHRANQCTSDKRCKKCNERHHTIIHPQFTSTNRAPQSSHIQSEHNQSLTNNATSIALTSSMSPNSSINQLDVQTSLSSGTSSSISKNTSIIFLQTAVVYVLNSSGVAVPCRAVLDSASHLHFISENLVKQLGLQRSKSNIPICGIGNTSTSTNGSTSITIRSRTSSFEASFEAEIMSKITNLQPQRACNIEGWRIPRNLNLADPQFHLPQKIDLLIGAELYLQLLSIGQIQLDLNLPTLQNTVLGWVISGKNNHSVDHPPNYSCLMVHSSQEDLSHIVERFWKLNEIDVSCNYSNEEEACELHFQKNVTRDCTGRYIVSLPLRQSAASLGDSFKMAHKRFLLLENRLTRNPELKQMYVEFMSDYERLGHMSAISEDQLASNHFYLPHHCVTKVEDGVSKIRVVFDASASSSNGKSLNSIMMIGPVVQNDLVSILIRFRLHKYAFSTDISKMYRQIRMTERDTHLQYILWRENPSSKLQTFRLTTVTYGTSAAPFLATRCLRQLAIDEQSNYSTASDVLTNDTYVDDILTGSNSLEVAQIMKADIVDIVKSAGMSLGKWCANHPTLLKDIPMEKLQPLLHIDEGEFTKTLGLYWSPPDDQFRFMVSNADITRRVTKRTIISDIARIFDPLGLCGPVIVLGKLFMQQLWKLNLDWDESLPQNLHSTWRKFQNELSLLNNLRIQRHISPLIDPNNHQLHGFSDASERAYGACLYLRTANNMGDVAVHLICSKSRVSPINVVSLPRLELCAAVLLAELVKSVAKNITIVLDSTHYWTDSQIVLSWIRASSSTWKTFVANRVSTIQSMSQISQWHHVNSLSNPADLVSRGSHPQQFIESRIWFNGPEFLNKNESLWLFNLPSSEIQVPERKVQRDALTTSNSHNDILDLNKFQNSYIKFRNTHAYVIRFIHNISVKDKSNRRIGHLSIEEVRLAINSIVKIIQFNNFGEELRCLQSDKAILKTSKLTSLHPFLDNGIIRVGGRLSNSSLPYSTKFPIILPSSHSFTISLASYHHKRAFHCGPNALIAILRSEYWPLNGRHLARKVVRSCITCFKARPISGEQFMADLPSTRVNIANPFQNVGIDLCGPFYVSHRIRGKAPTKSYLVVFVCFAVKAVHLELVTELTTAAFIGAFKRFISTRGLCSNVYTDNATNFVGTCSELKDLQRLFQSQQHKDAIIEMCQEDQVVWHFAPPASPHFGGMYESAVKSAKFHLRRILSNARLSLEELTTVIKQTEAILNSRPLSPMSSDPNDLQVITPGHFLIGRPLTSFVEPNIEEEVVSPLKRWRLVQQLQQHFWNRWSYEYLTELQQRRIWTKTHRNVCLNELVLLKEDNLPPFKWKMGRIIHIHPGSDGLVRVVDVKTAHGTYTRSITKVCPMPINTIQPDGSQHAIK